MPEVGDIENAQQVIEHHRGNVQNLTENITALEEQFPTCTKEELVSLQTQCRSNIEHIISGSEGLAERMRKGVFTTEQENIEARGLLEEYAELNAKNHILLSKIDQALDKSKRLD